MFWTPTAASCRLLRSLCPIVSGRPMLAEATKNSRIFTFSSLQTESRSLNLLVCGRRCIINIMCLHGAVCPSRDVKMPIGGVWKLENFVHWPTAIPLKDNADESSVRLRTLEIFPSPFISPGIDPLFTSSSSTRSRRGPYDHVWWILSTGQLLACCCCPCIAGQSIGCWDDLGDASSFGREDGRESDRHDIGVLGGLACLQEA